MNKLAVLRWQIARLQLDGIPNRLSFRANGRRDYWLFKLDAAGDELAEQMPEDAA